MLKFEVRGLLKTHIRKNTPPVVKRKPAIYKLQIQSFCQMSYPDSHICEDIRQEGNLHEDNGDPRCMRACACVRVRASVCVLYV